jgi:hypothetical protein
MGVGILVIDFQGNIFLSSDRFQNLQKQISLQFKTSLNSLRSSISELWSKQKLNDVTELRGQAVKLCTCSSLFQIYYNKGYKQNFILTTRNRINMKLEMGKVVRVTPGPKMTGPAHVYLKHTMSINFDFLFESEKQQNSICSTWHHEINRIYSARCTCLFS